MRLAALDGLRGLAAAIVVVAHVSNATGLWGGRLGMGGGQIGVMLFFVLSGYLMGAVYLTRQPTHAHVRNYAVHRLSRVVPLFYLVLLAAILLNSMIGGGLILFGLNANRALRAVSFIRAPDVLWTVPVEIQFYAVFLGVWWLHAKHPSATSFGLLGCFFTAMLYQPDVDTSFGWLPFHAAFFLGGVLVSLGQPRLGFFALQQWPFQSGLTILLPAAVFLAPRLYSDAFGTVGQWLLISGRDTWHQPLYLIVSLGCLLAAIRARPAIWLLSTWPMTYLGRISYSLYLVHMPVVIALLQSAALSRQPMLFLLATALLAGAASSVLNSYVERPLQRRLNQWLAVSQTVPRERTTKR